MSNELGAKQSVPDVTGKLMSAVWYAGAIQAWRGKAADRYPRRH